MPTNAIAICWHRELHNQLFIQILIWRANPITAVRVYPWPDWLHATYICSQELRSAEMWFPLHQETSQPLGINVTGPTIYNVSSLCVCSLVLCCWLDPVVETVYQIICLYLWNEPWTEPSATIWKMNVCVSIEYHSNISSNFRLEINKLKNCTEVFPDISQRPKVVLSWVLILRCLKQRVWLVFDES